MDFNQKVDMVTIGYYLAEAFWGKGHCIRGSCSHRKIFNGGGKC